MSKTQLKKSRKRAKKLAENKKLTEKGLAEQEEDEMMTIDNGINKKFGQI